MYKTYVALMEKHANLMVIAFPCNQFGKQEPGSPAAIKRFAEDRYGFKGLLMNKIDVNGPDAHPLWRYMTHLLPLKGKEAVQWNFEKFLIDTHGDVVHRFSAGSKMEELEKQIHKLEN